MTNNIIEQKVTETLDVNYLPYAIATIVSRAIVGIDGFKPSHRKLLYTMFKMGLLDGMRTKSANIVGTTMRLNPHGDMSIYETMVRLSQNDTLLVPYVEGKGNFGMHTSRDMQPASHRYTEAKLSKICNEIFKDINKDSVDFVDNYDGTMKEPILLPTTFPNILVNANMGIAVGMTSNICSFNLAEICNATIEYMKNPKVDLTKFILAPDFATGGILLYDKDTISNIYEKGIGSVKVRAKYRYNSHDNCIEIYEIPYSTTREVIIEKVVELIKNKTITEITDIRDETDLHGMKIVIDLKRNVDYEKLMNILYLRTPLQDNFSCLFNVLIDGKPQVLGVRGMLEEWIKFRIDTLKRQIKYDIDGKSRTLHLLEGLTRLDIDKAIKIIRKSKTDSEVINNLMFAFKLSEEQAEYVANIKLRNLNEDYILQRTKDIGKLDTEIKTLQGVLNSDDSIKKIIAFQLKEVSKRYGAKRKTDILYNTEEISITEEIPNYNVNFYLTKEGYFKKIALTSLRGINENRVKEGDRIIRECQGENTSDVLLFTNKGNVYRIKPHKIEDMKPSQLGLYLSSEFKLDTNTEYIVDMVVTNYGENENILIFYKNGFIARINIGSYQSSYSVLKGSPKDEIIGIEKITNDVDVMLISSEGKCLIFNTSEINTVSNRNSVGVKGIKLNDGSEVLFVKINPTSKMELSAKSIKRDDLSLIIDDVGYYKGGRANVGVFVYNCRAKNDILLSIT